MGQLNPPATIAQFQAQFVRDFIYGPGPTAIMPSDIQNGLNLASSVFNPALFDLTPIGLAPNVTSEALICYLNAAAHFMVLSIQANGGLGQKGRGVIAQGEGVFTSKSAGGVNITQQWPSYILDNPVLYSLTRTTYGTTYLTVLVTKMVGNVAAVLGEVTGYQSTGPGTYGFPWYG